MLTKEVGDGRATHHVWYSACTIYTKMLTSFPILHNILVFNLFNHYMYFLLNGQQNRLSSVFENSSCNLSIYQFLPSTPLSIPHPLPSQHHALLFAFVVVVIGKSLITISSENMYIFVRKNIYIWTPTEAWGTRLLLAAISPKESNSSSLGKHPLSITMGRHFPHSC